MSAIATNPTITRTESGRYLVGNVPASYPDADTAMAVYAELVQRIGRIEHAAAQVQKLKDVAG
jgi:hypothetical protein